MTVVAGRTGPGFLTPRTTYAHHKEGTTPRGPCVNGLLIFPASLSPLCPSFSLLLLSYPFCSRLQFFLFITVQFLHFLFLPILCSHPPFIWLPCPQHPGDFMGPATFFVSPQALFCYLLFVYLSASRFKHKLLEGKTMSDSSSPVPSVRPGPGPFQHLLSEKLSLYGIF